MDTKTSIWLPVLKAGVVAIVLLGMGFLDLSFAVKAHSPTPFIASPYYGTSSYSRRWIPGVHYGIDFLLNYSPVLAAASGTIEFAGWYNSACHDESMPGCEGVSQSGFGLYVRIYHGPSGHPYYTYYGHLSAARAAGGSIAKGEWIGTSGDTGYSTTPHLHFEVRHGGTAQSNAVNPDNEGGVSLWTEGEWSDPSNPTQSVPAWALPSLTAYGTALIVDDNTDNSGGFTKGKNSNVACPPESCPYWWRETTLGYSGDMYWTYVNGSVVDYWAEWRPSIPSTTMYEVQAYIPCNYATTWRAPYQIVNAVATHNVIVDQLGLCNQWIGLGVYRFSNGTAGYVRLTDATGESGSTSRRVGVDAVRFRPVYIGPFDAENYRERVSRNGFSWELRTSLSGYLGSGYMQALPNSGTNYDTGYTTSSPELRFKVVFPVAGTYYIWIRGYGGSGGDDSLHAGIDGQGLSSADRITGCGWSGAGWIWCNSTSDGPRATLYSTLGLHTLNLWMREDGFRVDRVLLTTDAGFTP